MLFHEWFNNLREFLEKDKDKLTEQVEFKLNEIIQFVDQFGIVEKEHIPFVE